MKATDVKPTQILSAEHRWIETVLDCLERIAENARQQAALQIDAAESAVRFLRTFADACHHGKEEQLLFPMLLERGMPRGMGPVAMMLDEHETGRALIHRLVSSLEAYKRGDTQARLSFADAANAYVELLREHIAKEDNVLFPLAEGMLSDADRDRLLAAFERVETHELGVGTHQDMERIAEELAARYGVKRASERTAAKVGGCCHGMHVTSR